MKTHGGFEQCYNAQAAVDVEDMLIVGTSLGNNGSDAGTLGTTLDAVRANGEQPGSVLADAGYFSEANIEECENRQIEAYIAIGRDKHNRSPRDRNRQHPPRGWSLLRRMMWYRLHHELGREMYRYRKMSVETVFGIVKAVMGFRRFMLRGIDKVDGEWDLVGSAYNIRRLWQLSMA